MRKFFYIFLILSLIIRIPVFASGTDRDGLLSKTKELYKFITEKISGGHSFDDSLRDQIIEYTASIVGTDKFGEQYKLLRVAVKNTDKFEKKFKAIYERSDEVSDLLNGASQEVKREHPNEVRPERTVVFSMVDTIISNKDTNNTTTNGGEGSVFASSMIEGDAAKPKQNVSDFDKLKSDNEQLRTKNNLLSMLIESLKNEKIELMDKQVELSAENGGLKERVTSLEQQNQLNLRDIEKVKSINDLYEQVVDIYQRITKSNKDFEQIIRLMKQIEGKKGEK